jgi:hypothetical protein
MFKSAQLPFRKFPVRKKIKRGEKEGKTRRDLAALSLVLEDASKARVSKELVGFQRDWQLRNNSKLVK